MPASNVTLYAQWTINSYSVSYDGNNNDGDSDHAPRHHFSQAQGWLDHMTELGWQVSENVYAVANAFRAAVDDAIVYTSDATSPVPVDAYRR